MTEYSIRKLISAQKHRQKNLRKYLFADQKGNKDKAKEYYREVLDLSEYESLKKEAKTYIKES